MSQATTAERIEKEKTEQYDKKLNNKNKNSCRTISQEKTQKVSPTNEKEIEHSRAETYLTHIYTETS